MNTIKKEIHLYAIWGEACKEWGYYVTDSGPGIMGAQGWVHVESKTVEFDRPGPDADWSAGAIELTRKEQARIRAEAQAKINALDERINSMLAIEHKVPA
jgi:hypothetical protein